MQLFRKVPDFWNGNYFFCKFLDFVKPCVLNLPDSPTTVIFTFFIGLLKYVNVFLCNQQVLILGIPN